ncbi:MAG TPA: extracellular solute-binding protein [Propionibacteriaceae bacterium]|nr:extracellular solute-binding protein [Propionibacteriaceae bacterium]
MSRLTRAAGAFAAIFVLLGVTSCSDGDGGGGEGGDTTKIVVWTGDTIPDRVAKSKAIIAKFTEKTGIQVELVGVDEDQFNQLLTSAAAAGELPDVVGTQPLAAIRTLSANDLLNTDATAAIIESLGADTFSARSLELTREGETQLAVPSDAWSQVLYYRKDLFEAKGLKAPQTYDDVMAAAKALDSPKVAGFVGATTPGDAFTQQTFEHLALANGCQMVDQAGEVTMESPQCVAAFQFYGDLIKNYSVSGTQDVDTVRAAYFAGQSAMAVWSTFLLDELAGLRNDAKPSCAECKKDPEFLAKNTGVVPAITGPDGTEPAQFGEVSSWAITTTGAAEPSQKFIEYMLSDGYTDWIAIAPEGKFPVRSGTAEKPTEYVDAWQDLEVGVDTKAPLSKFYPQEVIDILSSGADKFSRWGITQGQGDLIGASLGELPVPKAIGALTGGQVDAAGAAKQAADELRTIKKSLE